MSFFDGPRPRSRWVALGAVTALVGAGAAFGLGLGPTQAPAIPGAPPINGTDRVYTADQTSNTVTVINPNTRTVLGTIALGDQRLGGVLGPQYLRDVGVHGLGFSRDTIDVVRVSSRKVVQRITGLAQQNRPGYDRTDLTAL